MNAKDCRRGNKAKYETQWAMPKGEWLWASRTLKETLRTGHYKHMSPGQWTNVTCLM
jgi:hypothetical protein